MRNIIYHGKEISGSIFFVVVVVFFFVLDLLGLTLGKPRIRLDNLKMSLRLLITVSTPS